MHDQFVCRACVRAWLAHVRAVDLGMRELESRIREARDRLEGLGAPLGGGGGGSASSDKMADGVARVLALEEQWAARVCALSGEVQAARDLCAPPNVGRYAVWLHEFERMSWPEVGRAIGYSEKQARRIAEGGERELYYLIPEEYRRDTFPNAAPE